MVRNMLESPADLLTIRQAMKRLGLSRTLVYKLMYEGILPYISIGRTRRIDPIDLAALVRAHRTGGTCAA